ncbi:complex I subunit 4 family protein [Ktedonospora formicarum]|uniref:NADH-quinone oxidoreductase subunit M n=1 Tax=Ktedonospora formicarum TaxID=2778364 RepID=A0A8J3HW96_9CHLR|nr:NADH-quinone oxidoreductase subunit M [Ktedonospora formicarum]GHO44391.1 NADH-quinone oxidoreductase subunit M [Ktedonospora formicarum]
MQSYILSILIFLPLLGGAVTLCLPKESRKTIRAVSLAFAGANLLLALILALLYTQASIGAFSQSNFQEHIVWIPSIGINYTLDVDGISLLLVVLTSLLSMVCMAASYRQEKKFKNYMAFLLLLQSGILGVFLSANLFLFYIFWELMLIPAYFLVGAWGGERRIAAAFKFVLYTSVGSLLMLAGIIAVGYFYSLTAGSGCGVTLDIGTLTGGLTDASGSVTTCAARFDSTTQFWLLLAFAAAFAVKIPFVPFHSWLPDTYSEAPAPVTAILAGAMSKTGAYGFLRICIPLFPQAIHTLAPFFSILAVIGILYCAVLALVQSDLKRLLGYSSISHLGIVMLGMFAFNTQGVEGSVLQMVNHGITTAALFLIAGYVEERAGTRNIADFGGIAKRVPVLATVMLIAALSSLGLPGLNSFAGEFLSLLGAFRNNVTLGTLGTLVVVPAAWYMLRFFQGVMTGPSPTLGLVAQAERRGALLDIRMGEFLALLPLLALIFYIGFQPEPLTFLLHQPVLNTMQNLGNAFIK